MPEKQQHGGNFLMSYSAWDCGHRGKDAHAIFCLGAAHHWPVPGMMKLHLTWSQALLQFFFSSKIPTLRHIGGDFGNQVQASGTSGVVAGPGSFCSVEGPKQKQPHFPHLRATKTVWLHPPSVPRGPTVNKRKRHSKFSE